MCSNFFLLLHVNLSAVSIVSIVRRYIFIIKIMAVNISYTKFLVRSEVSLIALNLEKISSNEWRCKMKVILNYNNTEYEICEQATASKKKQAKAKDFQLIIYKEK